jgi:hypothetical protein
MREEIVEALANQMLKETGVHVYTDSGDIAKSIAVGIARDIVAGGVPYILVNAGKAIMCLQCGAVSHNPNDVEKRWCGACQEFLDGVARA